MSGNIAAVSAPMEPVVKDADFREEARRAAVGPGVPAEVFRRIELAGVIAKIGLKGNALTLAVPGQPEFTLVPDLGGVFTSRSTP